MASPEGEAKSGGCTNSVILQNLGLPPHVFPPSRILFPPGLTLLFCPLDLLTVALSPFGLDSAGFKTHGLLPSHVRLPGIGRPMTASKGLATLRLSHFCGKHPQVLPPAGLSKFISLPSQGLDKAWFPS
jgi:hypothetical protein